MRRPVFFALKFTQRKFKSVAKMNGCGGNHVKRKKMQALRTLREIQNSVQDLIWLANLAKEALKTNPPSETKQIELVECFRQPRLYLEEEPWKTEAEPFDTGWVICRLSP